MPEKAANFGFRTLVGTALGGLCAGGLPVTSGEQLLLQLVLLGLIQHRFVTGRRQVMDRKILCRRRRPRWRICGQPDQGRVGDRGRATAERKAKQQQAGQSRRLPNPLYVAPHGNSYVLWSRSARFLLCEWAGGANLSSAESVTPRENYRRGADRVHEALM